MAVVVVECRLLLEVLAYCKQLCRRSGKFQECFRVVLPFLKFRIRALKVSVYEFLLSALRT